MPPAGFKSASLCLCLLIEDAKRAEFSYRSLGGLLVRTHSGVSSLHSDVLIKVREGTKRANSAFVLGVRWCLRGQRLMLTETGEESGPVKRVMSLRLCGSEVLKLLGRVCR